MNRQKASLDDGFDCEIISLLPALRNAARALRPDVDDADDLVALTLEGAIANVDHYRGAESTLRWLHAIMIVLATH